jgi:hypothetical protein
MSAASVHSTTTVFTNHPRLNLLLFRAKKSTRSILSSTVVSTAANSSTLSARRAMARVKTLGNPPGTWHMLKKPLPDSTKRIQLLHVVSVLLSLMNSGHCSVPLTSGPTPTFFPILPILAGNLVNTLVWMPRRDARTWKGGNVAVAPYFLLFSVFFSPALVATAPHT